MARAHKMCCLACVVRRFLAIRELFDYDLLIDRASWIHTVQGSPQSVCMHVFRHFVSALILLFSELCGVGCICGCVLDASALPVLPPEPQTTSLALVAGKLVQRSSDVWSYDMPDTGPCHHCKYLLILGRATIVCAYMSEFGVFHLFIVKRGSSRVVVTRGPVLTIPL